MMAGSLAGGCGIFVGHPFDSLKVRLQVGQVLEYKTFNWSVLRQLYRGVMTPLLTVGSISAMNFTLYENCKKLLHNAGSATAERFAHSMVVVGDGIDSLPFEDQELSPYPTSLGSNETTLVTVFNAGLISGLISTAITTPIGILKIQMQIASEAGMFNVIKQIYQTRGLRTFYRGYLPATICEAPGRGVYLWTYEAVKAQVHHAKAIWRSENSDVTLSDYLYKDGVVVHGDHIEISTRVIAAACAGIFSWFVIYPADVIKARVQLDIGKKKYKDSWHCVKDTWRDGGWRGMFRGLSYTLIRAGPVAGTILPIYDIVKSKVEEALN